MEVQLNLVLSQGLVVSLERGRVKREREREREGGRQGEREGGREGRGREGGREGGKREGEGEETVWRKGSQT